MKKKKYDAPEAEMLVVRVETGFLQASTQIGGGTSADDGTYDDEDGN